MDRHIRRSRRTPAIAAGLLLALAVVSPLALACNRVEVAPEVENVGPVPTEPAPTADLSLRLSLDKRFQVDRQEGAALVLRLPDVPDVELWMAVGRDPIGGPMPDATALAERALRFLEPVHGKVEVSTTAAGDSLLAFSSSLKDGNRELHTWNWMVLRPGADDVLRADVSLRVPGPWAERPEFKGLAGHVAERLASSEFEPDS